MNKKNKMFKNKYANILVEFIGSIFSFYLLYLFLKSIIFPMIIGTLGQTEIGQAKTYTIQNTQINVVQNSTIGSFLYENFALSQLEDYMLDLTDAIYFYPGNPDEYAYEIGWTEKVETIEGVAGMTYPKYKGIILNSEAYQKSVLLHEIGHLIDHHWNSASETEDFQQILAEEAEALWPTPVVDDYSKSTPAESFAEGYALYYTNPSRMKRKAPRMYAYFDYIVQTERKIHAEKVAEQGA